MDVLFVVENLLTLDIPVKNLSSQLTHYELSWKLTASSFWSHSSTTQLTQETISHYDLATSPPWVSISHRELAVTCSWDQPISSPCSGCSELTVISLWTSQWDIQVSPLWVCPPTQSWLPLTARMCSWLSKVSTWFLKEQKNVIYRTKEQFSLW